MVMTAVTLLLHRGLAPPASEESEAIPVTVSVRTVVVRSGEGDYELRRLVVSELYVQAALLLGRS
jgi:hypothetical protein